MTITRSAVPITDDRGNLLLSREDCFEPQPGSVVLTHGIYGTAWQRYFVDGRWRRVGGGKSVTWDSLLAKRNLVLIYDAPERGQ